jgi:hypothetical protein
MLGFFKQFHLKQDTSSTRHHASRISPVAPVPRDGTFCLPLSPQGVSFKNYILNVKESLNVIF